jgi:hypothetical protein
MADAANLARLASPLPGSVRSPARGQQRGVGTANPLPKWLLIAAVVAYCALAWGLLLAGVVWGLFRLGAGLSGGWA